MFDRALVRAQIKLKYSEGFNPRPKLSLPLPRSVGVAAEDDLFCVGLVGGVHRLLEGACLSCHHVLQGAALHPGENRPVDPVAVFGLGDDKAAARAAKRLVRGGGDELRDRQRVVVQPGRHQPGIMGHVHEQQGTAVQL